MRRMQKLLCDYRSDHDLTWREMALMVGQTSRYLHDVARGRRRCRPQSARRYAEALSCDPQQWITAALLDCIEDSIDE